MQFYGNKQKNNITFAEKTKQNVDPTDASNCTVENKGLVCFFGLFNLVLDQDTILLIVISYSKTPKTHLRANEVHYI